MLVSGHSAVRAEERALRRSCLATAQTLALVGLFVAEDSALRRSRCAAAHWHRPGSWLLKSVPFAAIAAPRLRPLLKLLCPPLYHEAHELMKGDTL